MPFLLEKIVIEFFAAPEKYNLPRYIENDIFYNFTVVLDTNFIEKHRFVEKYFWFPVYIIT